MDSQKVFQLVINGVQKSFSSQQDLVKYLEDERSSFSWMTGTKFNFLQELYKNRYGNSIGNLLNQLSAAHDGSVFVGHLGDSSWEYVSSDSFNGQLIKSVRDEHGDVVAAFVLYYLAADERNKNDNNHVGVALKNTIFEREKSLAQYIANSTRDIRPLSIKASDGGVKRLLGDFKAEVDTSLATIEDLKNSFASSAERLQSQNKSLSDYHVTRIHRRVGAYQGLIRRARDAGHKTYTDTLEDISAAQKAYHDAVDIQASVTYWSDRQEEHKKAKRTWLGAAVGGMVVMFFVMLLYYATGGISSYAFAKEVTSVPVVSAPDMGTSKPVAASESATGKAVEKVNTKNVLAEQSVVSEDKISTATKGLSGVIADSVGTLILVTIFGALIRLSLRQFNVHSELELNAMEKVTLTKTYLALLGENKLDGEGDRRLVLEGLFRPSNPNVAAAEAAFATPIELILKSVKP
ncbi:hypothetical protein IPC1429_22750 [Pseudomonas aeruginosa]|uniref:hypothetical protein n=1 Tax=Pseudomonas aeruginosa TaxID=287 RepID=UPI000FD4A100|nr:hypothetical protein [Pseudomonas aeruginosa]RUB35591.1 hypothetical protein IPC1429_22750 [Pseudomonas aeruginosa]